ncbi:MAG: hypothetical protein WBN32_15035, partial [Woeseia sp.]
MHYATLFRRLAFVAIALTAGTTIQAQNIIYAGPDGNPVEGERCATPELSLDQQLAVNAYLEEFLAANPDAANRQDMYLIPIAYHIVTNTAGAGNISDADIEEQTDVLNAAFASMNIQFETASIDRTANNTWYTVTPNSPAETAMKAALAIDPASTLNIYTANIGGG